MDKADNTDAVVKNSLFLVSLEKWLDAVIIQDGLTDKQIVAKVRDSFRRAIEANIDHHVYMADNPVVDGRRDRHALLAEIYKELLS
jgi:hypothetical protein